MTLYSLLCLLQKWPPKTSRVFPIPPAFLLCFSWPQVEGKQFQLFSKCFSQRAHCRFCSKCGHSTCQLNLFKGQNKDSGCQTTEDKFLLEPRGPSSYTKNIVECSTIMLKDERKVKTVRKMDDIGLVQMSCQTTETALVAFMDDLRWEKDERVWPCWSLSGSWYPALTMVSFWSILQM